MAVWLFPALTAIDAAVAGVTLNGALGAGARPPELATKPGPEQKTLFLFEPGVTVGTRF